MLEITFKEKELDRLLLINQVQYRQLTDAAQALGLSERQIRRPWFRLLKEMVLKALNRGIKLAIEAFRREFKSKILKCIHKHYPDFEPSLAAEKLKELHLLHTRQFLV